MIQMQIRALDHFIPDHTLCVKLLDLELVLFLRLAASNNYFMLQAVGSGQACKLAATGKTASGWQQARMQAVGSRQDCKRSAAGKTSS